MNTTAKLTIGGLGAVVVLLLVVLGVVLASDEDAGGGDWMMGRGSDAYSSMMQAISHGDSDHMLEAMRSALGPDDYEAMLEHLREHRNGEQPMGDGGIDGMMHRMMDGIFERMPADSNNVMPMMP